MKVISYHDVSQSVADGRLPTGEPGDAASWEEAESSAAAAAQEESASKETVPPLASSGAANAAKEGSEEGLVVPSTAALASAGSAALQEPSKKDDQKVPQAWYASDGEEETVQVRPSFLALVFPKTFAQLMFPLSGNSRR